MNMTTIQTPAFEIIKDKTLSFDKLVSKCKLDTDQIQRSGLVSDILFLSRKLARGDVGTDDFKAYHPRITCLPHFPHYHTARSIRMLIKVTLVCRDCPKFRAFTTSICLYTGIPRDTRYQIPPQFEYPDCIQIVPRHRLP